MAWTTESALVEAARAGDPAALNELLREYLPLVYNVVGRALQGEASVDDVVQETMLRAVARLPDLRDPARFRAWLVSIAIRQIQDQRRAAGTAQVRQVPLEEAATGLHTDSDADFSDAVTTRLSMSAQRKDLLAATRWLNPDEREVLALWWQEIQGQLTRAELAEALALSPQHVAVRVQRMKSKLMLALTVVRAWQSTPRCAQLSVVAPGWHGDSDALRFKRLARHVRGCQACAATADPFDSIEHQVVGLGPLPLPGLLLQHVVGTGVTAGSAGAASAAGAASSGHAVPAGVAIKHLLESVTLKTAAAIAAVVATIGFVTTVFVTAPPGADSGAGSAPPATVPVVVPLGGATPTRTFVPIAGEATPTPPDHRVIYLAPAGDDAGDGSLARPYATLTKAVSVVQPGQTIYLRGGTYRPTKPVDITTSGTATQPITLANYAGERPVLDAGSAPAGRAFVIQHADHWLVRGLEIINARHLPYVCESCAHNTFQALSIHDNRGTGFVLRGENTIGNLIVDSDFHDNHDDAGRDADGLAIIFGSGAGNVVRGCRTYHNVDDGVEVGEFTSPVTIDATWSYGNGVNRWNLPTFTGSGNGFSLGGASTSPAVAHVVTRSATWKNGGYGFTESGNTGRLQVTNNTAFRNVKDGFAFFFSPSQLRGNLALGNSRDAVLADSATAAANSWDQPGWSYSALRELDPASAEGPRRADGTLPVTAFLTNTKDATVGAPMTTDNPQ